MKNERIYIAIEKDDVPVHFGKFTKSEAIDKMARAIYSEMEKETKTIKNKYTLDSNKFAEAALNALLEDK